MNCPPCTGSTRHLSRGFDSADLDFLFCGRLEVLAAFLHLMPQLEGRMIARCVDAKSQLLSAGVFLSAVVSQSRDPDLHILAITIANRLWIQYINWALYNRTRIIRCGHDSINQCMP